MRGAAGERIRASVGVSCAGRPGPIAALIEAERGKADKHADRGLPVIRAAIRLSFTLCGAQAAGRSKPCLAKRRQGCCPGGA